MKPWVKSIGLVIAWLVIFGVFAALRPETFANARNLETIFRQTVIVGFAAVGMTFVIMIGAIDLSVGSLVALVTVIVAFLLERGMDPAAAAMAGVAAGAVAGMINGALTTQLRVGSFIVTLATLLAFRGVAKGLADEKTIPTDLTWLSNFTAALPPDKKWMVFPIGGWLVVLVAVIAGFLLHKTVFGRHVVATGSSQATAKMCGINTNKTQILVFVLAGLCFGLAGVMQFSRLTVGDPTVASGLELSVIAAVVIGGASLSGGEGSIFGSLIGALIMTTIATGATQLGWPNWVQEIITGGIIVTAVALDRWRVARAAEKATG